ncbi:MAG TPA: DUF58 domain-containing protein [Methylomirabilota bacterium]|jgi:uncharacterized protein (DUF58 family)|nr:DUF58 domain-containing protein [Methylomirabilota bacterium]
MPRAPRVIAPESPSVPAQRFFSNAFLMQLERLGFVSKRSHVGAVKGERKSPRRGSSVEFADYRPYEVGDDLRYVDWNAFARLNRLFLKVFIDEEDLCIHLLIDASGSMGYGEPSKLQYAVRLAAALAFIGFVNLERVGVAVFRDRVAEGWLPTRGRNQFIPIQDFLAGLTPGGPTSFNDALRQYARRAKDSGVAIVITDFLDPAGYAAGLRALMERRFDIHVLHLIAPEELHPSLAGDLELIDMETGEVREVSIDAEALRAYDRQLGAFLAGLEGFCRTNELNYVRVVTDTPVEDLLLRRLKGSLLQ